MRIKRIEAYEVDFERYQPLLTKDEVEEIKKWLVREGYIDEGVKVEILTPQAYITYNNDILGISKEIEAYVDYNRMLSDDMLGTGEIMPIQTPKGCYIVRWGLE